MNATMAGSTPTAEAVIIGNEVLSGKVRDENAPCLIDALRSAGVALKRISVVPDERDAIVQTVGAARGRVDHVFTSGGVGPTHDDITLPCVADALGRALIRHPELEALLGRLYGERLTEAHLRMADVPEGTELIHGGGLAVPAMRCENVYVLPGVPEIFRQKVQVLKSHLAGAPFHARYVYLTLGEGELAPVLQGIVADHPRVELGSYPKLDAPDYRTRVTLESKDRERVEAATAALLGAVPERVVVRLEDPAEDSVPVSRPPA